MTEIYNTASQKTHNHSNYYLTWSTYYIFLMISLPFIVLIPQYSFQYRAGDEQAHGWMESFYSSFSSSPDYFTAIGSITQHQLAFYSRIDINWALALHTLGGPMWLTCGFIQFNSFIRHNYKLVHRITGYCYFISLTVSLIGSASLLVLHLKEAPQTGDLSLIWTENGAYHMYLIIYWLGALITGCGGLYAIKNKQITRHRQWMVFNFSLAPAAAMLRILWTMFSWFYPQRNMGQITLICFQLIVFLGLIVSIYIVSIGDVDNQRGFKRFLAGDHNANVHKPNNIIFFAILLLNTMTTGAIGCMEFVLGDLSWYQWFGYDLSQHIGRASTGVSICWVLWCIASYLNIILFWFYRFNHKSSFYLKYFDHYFKLVSLWNVVCCIITFANVSHFDQLYDGVVDRDVFHGNTECFWILISVFILITNAQCLYYYFMRRDMDKTYEWMVWMVSASGFNFVIRYLYTFVVVAVFKTLYGNNNVQDLIASGYASWFEMIFILGLFWMIKETQSNQRKPEYGMISSEDL